MLKHFEEDEEIKLYKVQVNIYIYIKYIFPPEDGHKTEICSGY
jgi:hypothetical protein